MFLSPEVPCSVIALWWPVVAGNARVSQILTQYKPASSRPCPGIVLAVPAKSPRCPCKQHFCVYKAGSYQANVSPYCAAKAAAAKKRAATLCALLKQRACRVPDLFAE